MTKSKKPIRIGFDLDGVIAKHSFGGFWVVLRRLKERVLRGLHSSSYYYPSTDLEKLAWKVINWLRVPFNDEKELFSSLACGNEFYLVTGRFKFLEKQTVNWLKKYRLDGHFSKVLINTEDLNPILFKAKVIKKLGLDFFVDDDLEVIRELKKRTAAKLCWLVPSHRSKSDNYDGEIESCASLDEYLRRILAENFSPERPKKLLNSSFTN